MIVPIQMIVPQSKYNLKCPYPMSPKFIVVHNTANDASAVSEIQYMLNNNSSTSFHYAVDDKQVVQGISENRNAWHAGDGTNGEGNRYGIAVEICYSKSGGDKFVKAEQLAAQFIAQELQKYGWDLSHIKKHQDFSGKYCPHRTLDMGWQRFLNMVQNEMKEATDKMAKTKVMYGGKAYDAYIINGKTYVELRALGEALGFQVIWDDKTKTVEVRK